jgi:hypothetical protein
VNSGTATEIRPELPTARDVLDAATKLRMPRIPRDQGARARIDALEDYMLLIAWHQGELSEARLGLYDELRTVNDAWAELVGWENFRRGKTDASIDEAKAKARPDLARARRQAQWLVARLTEEIDRLEKDATKASRAYTLATGS